MGTQGEQSEQVISLPVAKVGPNLPSPSIYHSFSPCGIEFVPQYICDSPSIASPQGGRGGDLHQGGVLGAFPEIIKDHRQSRAGRDLREPSPARSRVTPV